jgi:hypothetical protein
MPLLGACHAAAAAAKAISCAEALCCIVLVTGPVTWIMNCTLLAWRPRALLSGCAGAVLIYSTVLITSWQLSDKSSVCSVYSRRPHAPWLHDLSSSVAECCVNAAAAVCSQHRENVNSSCYVMAFGHRTQHQEQVEAGSSCSVSRPLTGTLPHGGVVGWISSAR